MEIESPFLSEDLLVMEEQENWEPRAAALTSSSPFGGRASRPLPSRVSLGGDNDESDVGEEHEVTAPSLSFATTWLNTFKTCGQKSLESCDNVANGFGGVMKAMKHNWAIDLKESKGKRADWSDRTHGGADHAKGRGVDTVDFAMLVTHGGLRPNEQPPYWVAVFDQEPCRFQSNHARFGNGQLKWVVFDACRSLEIDEKKKISPKEIWKNAFDGLHMIFGFHNVVSDASWTEDRGALFAYAINVYETELSEAWLDAAYSYWLDDYPVVLTVGRDDKDARRRLADETLSSSFDDIPQKEAQEFVWRRRD